MSGGRSPRQKGNRVERELVRILQDRGIAAERIPLSGAAGGSFVGDVSIPMLGIDRIVQVKARRRELNKLYRWLTGHDLLVVKQDRLPLLAVVPIGLALEILTAAERNRQ